MRAAGRSGHLAAALFAVVLAFAGAAWARIAVPPVASVTDLTDTLTTSQQQELTQRLAAFEQAKGSQIAVLVVPTTQPETIEQYALRVAETWKLGRKGVDDGVLLLVARDDRALRIEVGYGLEGAIPDAIAKRVIDEIMLPRFREGDMPGGITVGVAQLIGLVQGESLPPPPGPSAFSPEDEQFPALVALLAGLSALGAAVLGFILKALFGRALAAVLVAGIAGGVVWWLTTLLLLAFVIAGICALVAWLVASPAPAPGGGGTGGGGSGRSDDYDRYSGGSSSGSSSGGSSFDGGGGSFGGGGASGRW